MAAKSPVRSLSIGTSSPGTKPKAPGERLPVPAGFRFCNVEHFTGDRGALPA